MANGRQSAELVPIANADRHHEVYVPGGSVEIHEPQEAEPKPQEHVFESVPETTTCAANAWRVVFARTALHNGRSQHHRLQLGRAGVGLVLCIRIRLSIMIDITHRRQLIINRRTLTRLQI